MTTTKIFFQLKRKPSLELDKHPQIITLVRRYGAVTVESESPFVLSFNIFEEKAEQIKWDIYHNISTVDIWWNNQETPITK